LTSFVFLDVYSSWDFRGNIVAQDNRCMQIQRLSSDKCDMGEISGDDLHDLIFDSGLTPRPDEPSYQKYKHLPVSLRTELTSNPFLFDLPPPVNHG
jgi:hypothetical protein